MEGGTGKAICSIHRRNLTGQRWRGNSILYRSGAVRTTIICSIGDEKHEPVNEDGNSAFEIPVDGFDYPMEVVADTVAMSTPHEIEYTLQFDSASIKEADK